MATKLQNAWEGKISKAKEKKKEWKEQFRVDLALRYFEGQQNPGYPENEWITVNKFYSHLQAQLPSLYTLDPYFYVKLKKAYNPAPELVKEYQDKGTIRQAMLNYLKGELRLKEKARLNIFDAHFQFGILKVRFSGIEVKHPKAGEPILDEEGKKQKDEAGEIMVYPKTDLINKKYVISRVHPDSFLFDEDAGPLEESWSWIAEEIKLTRKKAKETYKGKGQIIDKMEGKTDEKSALKKTKDFITGKKTEKKEDDILCFWEIYDLKEKEWLVFGESADDLIKDPQGLPAGMEDHPYSDLRFTLRDKSPYPVPPMSMAIDQQKEINLSRSRILTHRKRFNRKYEYLQQAIEPEELAKLENGDDGTCIGVMQLGVIRPIQDAPLDQQGYSELALLDKDMIETLGTPDHARSLSGADSATEAALLDKSLEVREGDRLSIVVDQLVRLARKLDQLVQNHVDKDEAIRIIGPEGDLWTQVRVEDYDKIDGEFEYSVNLGATRPRLPDIERSQWIAFMSQVVLPFPHILTAPNFLKRMAEMFHIEDEIALRELQELGQKIMSGQVPPPGKQGGGPPGGSVESQVIGQAMGMTGGNNNGGGSQLT